MRRSQRQRLSRMLSGSCSRLSRWWLAAESSTNAASAGCAVRQMHQAHQVVAGG